MLLPSLYALHEDALIAEDLRIVGTARSEMSDAEFREMAREALDEYLPSDRKDEGKIDTFLDHLQYQPLDASTLEGFDRLAEKLGDISGGVSRRIRVIEATTSGSAPADSTETGESDVHSSN